MITQGKWKITIIDGNTYIVARNLEIAKMCIQPTPTQTFREEEVAANAKHICQCVNGWDALQEQLADYKEGVEGLKLSVKGLRQQRDGLLEACEALLQEITLEDFPAVHCGYRTLMNNLTKEVAMAKSKDG